MSDTEQDKELREKISHRFDSVCAEGHQQSCGEYQTAVDDLMQLITADRKRVALEARIDELRLASDMQHMMRRADRVNYCSKRIAEIKALEKEKEEDQ